jgi:hypothetical protein
MLVFVGGALAATVACSGFSAVPAAQAASQIRVAISPTAATLSPSAQQQFTATVQGSGNSAVTWQASGGSIASNGTFTAPAANNGTQITVTAVSVSDSTQRASSTVTIQQLSPLLISGASLDPAEANTPYNENLSASGGTPPYRWTISAGASAPGIQLQSATGALTGTASQLGTYSFTAKVTDAAARSATQNFFLIVNAAGGSAFDGPAELPRVYLNTAMANTPAPGSVVSVNAGGDLQTALDNAFCGQTIQLQAGATFVTHVLTFPAKSCDDQHWIVVRTSTPNASLPAEASRMTPCYAGVQSLPGRPAFSCNAAQPLLATITFSGTGSGPIVFANGANHYRLIGLEITRTANDGLPVTALVSAETGGAMSQIVFDRLYLHGTPTDETRRGVALSGGTSIAVQDSYLSDFHCSVMGTCTDSQAISGGTGTLPMGPFRIVDNFLEAAGENIIFGGGQATQTPADIEIRFNHFFKPMFWLQGQAGFTAPAFIVKNLFEMKNAQRVLFDSNVLEDNWGGFSQSGYSIVITPRNQGNANANVCPLCQVTDITIRFVTISHAAGVFEIANAYSPPNNGAPLQGQRYSIHDVIADDIDGTKYVGHGNFAEISTIAAPVLQNVEINHVTAFAPHELFNVGGPGNVQMPGFTFTNNIVDSGQYPMWSTGTYGNTNCAHLDVPLSTMDQCFSGYSFSNNAIIGAPAQYGPSSWPSGNWFYSSASALDFVNYNNGNGGDYHLLSSSPAKGAASDGGDLGANVSAVLSAISGVQ